MISLSKVHGFLTRYLVFDQRLDVSKIDPHMANGLMVRGKEQVKKIGFGVSASLAMFEQAKKAHCDALIVHHSFNLPSANHYDSIFQNRMGFLIKHDLSLFGYHFLLDAHPEVGNNVQILKTIAAVPTKPFFHRGSSWGWIGEFEKEVSWQQIEERLKPYLSKRTVIYRTGPKQLKRLVAISGMGSPFPTEIHALKEQGVSGFITGEVHEWNRELFREAKINFIAGGHYATETFGIKALMEKVKKEFTEVTVAFIDVPNEI
ncbi:Nif3-like dinuclear metal center hexameric protein [Candidatus Gottesmanbacteria bacterium]|nr:Nif3-like dinuclear metal center hexameric protein [Candidatus Gottesmanbacteria bacterium]